MPGIKETVEQARARIARHPTTLGEQNTKAALIEPVLRSLGWDVEDVDEVHREYKQRSMDNPVDYALMLEDRPVLFVEAKGLRENLDDRRWAGQILGYAAVAGVEWVLVTNGDEYRIYNTHAPVPVQDKLFRSARVSDPGTAPELLLDLVSRSQMAEGVLGTLFKAHFVDQQVRAALTALFASDRPDPALVRLVGKHTKSLTAGDIRASLDRLHVTWAPATHTVAMPTDSTTSAKPSKDAHDVVEANDTGGRGPSPVLQAIMSQRAAQGPLELEKVYNGHQLTARVERDGRVTWGGRTYDSLSTAAGAARASIIGVPPGRKYPQTNGWVFWSFRDADGRLKPMDVLRKQVHSGGS
jgi:hypothetical protein